MFSPLQTISAGALVALLSSCANVSLTIDYDRAADFSKYRSYGWAPALAAGQQRAPSIQDRIHRAVDAGLTAKGFTLSTGPAFIVSARYTTNQQIAVHRHTDWAGAGVGAGKYNGIAAIPAHLMTDVDQFTEGTVSLDFIDAETHRLIWRGEGAIVVGTSAENARNAEEAVARLLARFPPKRRRAN